jgi:hypothetical protein
MLIDVSDELSKSIGSEGKPSKQPATRRKERKILLTLAYSSTLKMEAVRYTETSMTYRTTRGQIPEDSNLPEAFMA